MEKLTSYRNSVLAEKNDWEKQKEKLEKKMLGTYRKRVISLDVGGTHQIRTSQDLLCKVEGSLLQQMFCGVHDLPINQSGNVFLDRDGSTFLSLINYLRNNRDDFP